MHMGAMQTCLFVCKHHILFQPRITYISEVIITLEVRWFTGWNARKCSVSSAGNLISVTLVILLCSHQTALISYNHAAVSWSTVNKTLSLLLLMATEGNDITYFLVLLNKIRTLLWERTSASTYACLLWYLLLHAGPNLWACVRDYL